MYAFDERMEDALIEQHNLRVEGRNERVIWLREQLPVTLTYTVTLPGQTSRQEFSFVMVDFDDKLFYPLVCIDKRGNRVHFEEPPSPSTSMFLKRKRSDSAPVYFILEMTIPSDYVVISRIFKKLLEPCWTIFNHHHLDHKGRIAIRTLYMLGVKKGCIVRCLPRDILTALIAPFLCFAHRATECQICRFHCAHPGLCTAAEDTQSYINAFHNPASSMVGSRTNYCKT